MVGSARQAMVCEAERVYHLLCTAGGEPILRKVGPNPEKVVLALSTASTLGGGAVRGAWRG